jgi:hypothetical protein
LGAAIGHRSSTLGTSPLEGFGTRRDYKRTRTTRDSLRQRALKCDQS